ncbi:YHS domain-containing protein [Acidobacteriota bacterium]
MSKQLKVFALFLVLSFVVVLTGIAETNDNEKVTCAMSGHELEKSEAKSYEYEGKTYYFCSEGCRDTFKKDPEKYIKNNGHEGHMGSHESHMESHQGNHHSEEQAENKAVDPVCGMKIKKSDAKATPEFDGKSYYFCTEECKEKFEENPEEFVKESEKTVTCPVKGTKITKSNAAGTYEYEGKNYYFCCAGCKEKFVADPEKYIHKH